MNISGSFFTFEIMKYITTCFFCIVAVLSTEAQTEDTISRIFNHDISCRIYKLDDKFVGVDYELSYKNRIGLLIGVEMDFDKTSLPKDSTFVFSSIDVERIEYNRRIISPYAELKYYQPWIKEVEGLGIGLFAQGKYLNHLDENYYPQYEELFGHPYDDTNENGLLEFNYGAILFYKGVIYDRLILDFSCKVFNSHNYSSETTAFWFVNTEPRIKAGIRLW